MNPDSEPDFLSAYAIGTDARELVNICLRTLGGIDDRYNFGFIYVSDALANQLPRLMTLLVNATSVEHWCGTLATGICINDQELYDQAGIAILLCRFKPDSWQTFANVPDGSKLDTLDHNFKPGFGIVHANPSNPSMPEMLAQLQSLNTELNVVGGLTLSQTQPLQVSGNGIVDGASGVLFDTSTTIISDITQGCSPIGQYHEISAAEHNFVLRLDDRPALDVLRDEIGEVLSKNISQLGGYIFAGISKNTTTEAPDNYLVRNLLAIDEIQGALAISENIDIGDRLVFCRRDGNTASTDLDMMLDRIKEKLNGSAPRAAIYQSCINRGRQLFGENSQELKRIQASLGETPLVGFFAAGEIYQGQTYSHSGVLTVFV